MTRTPTIFDMETHRIKCGMNTPKLVCMSVLEPGGEPKLVGREEALDIVEGYLDDHRSLANQNIPYDLKVAAAERERLIPKIFDAIERGNVEDLIVRQKMIDNAAGKLKFVWNDVKDQWEKQRPYFLHELVKQHCDVDISDSKKKSADGKVPWRLNFHKLDGVPVSEYPEDASKYVLDDSVWPRKIWESQEGTEGLYNQESQMRATWALELMSTWGPRTDPEMVAAYKGELEGLYQEQLVICQDFGFRRKTGKAGSRDMKKIRAAVETWYKDAGRKMKLTPKSQVSTDREQLTSTDHPGLLAVAQSVKLEKKLTTYIPALERGTTYPLNSKYNPIIESYRTSCSSGGKIDGIYPGMNLQNLPREGMLRNCFIPRDGWVYAFCDYDTLEMRTLAQICLDLFGYSHLAEALRAGEDPHLSLAADTIGMAYSKAVSLYESGDKKVADARQFCKIGNYGLGGGMGPNAFVSYAKGYGIAVTKDHAFSLWKNYRGRWKETVEYFDVISNMCREGPIERLEVERSGLIRGGVSYTQACNHHFQHLAAMGAKESLWRVAKECYVDTSSPLYGCRPWLFAHDEIGMEIPEKAFGPKRTHEAAMRLQRVMIEAMEEWVPDVPIGATVATCRRWIKGAKPLFEKGLLVPSKKVDGKWVSDAR
jgi:hypothetical protein